MASRDKGHTFEAGAARVVALRRRGVRTFHVAVADKVTLTKIVTDNGTLRGLFGNIGLMAAAPVWELESRAGDIITPQRPIAANDNPLILLPLSALQPTWRNLLPTSSQSKVTQLRHGPLKTFAAQKHCSISSLYCVHTASSGRGRMATTSDGKNSYSHWPAQQLRGRSRRASSSRQCRSVALQETSVSAARSPSARRLRNWRAALQRQQRPTGR